MSQKPLSASKTILAILWRLASVDLKTLRKHPYAEKFFKTKSPNTFNTALVRLKRDGIIERRGSHVTLTAIGRRAALFAFIDAETKIFKRPMQVWDGGWRIIFFDIPEARRQYRDYLRSVLKTIGFREFQRSVWAYPYQVPNFLRELLGAENIKEHVRFISAPKVDFDQDLRKLFSIK